MTQPAHYASHDQSANGSLTQCAGLLPVSMRVDPEESGRTLKVIQEISLQRLHHALSESKNTIETLRTELQKCSDRIGLLEEELRRVSSSIRSNEVDVPAEAVHPMTSENIHEPKFVTTNNPCVLMFCDKVFRKLKLTKPDLDLYSRFAGNLTFGRFTMITDITSERVVREVNAFLEQYGDQKVHVMVHSGLTEIMEGAQKGKPVSAVVDCIIAPLTKLRNDARVLSMSWITMVEAPMHPTIRLINEEILKCVPVKCGTVNVIDLRLISYVNGNLGDHRQTDVMSLNYSPNGLKVVFTRLESEIIMRLELNDEDLKLLDEQSREFVRMNQLRDAERRKHFKVAPKRQTLDVSTSKAENRQCFRFDPRATSTSWSPSQSEEFTRATKRFRDSPPPSKRSRKRGKPAPPQASQQRPRPRPNQKGKPQRGHPQNTQPEQSQRQHMTTRPQESGANDFFYVKQEPSLLGERRENASYH